MKKILFFVMLLFSLSFYGQRQASNWYFGNNAGLNFNNGVPSPLLDGQIDTVEGCTSISHKETGQLLFYTEGRQVWNRNHELMPNGDELLGSFSSTQSALVIPLPGSDTLFYIFTSDVVRQYQVSGSGNGFNYSIVDITRNGGLGDVIEKNIELLPNGSEKLTAVNAANGEDFWILTHFGASFYAYKVTSSGVDPAVVSTIGPNISDFNNIRGAIKASPDGSKLAVAHLFFQPSFGGLAYVYDFDSETGVVSDQILLGDDLVYYGTEFSPNSSKLYFSSKSLDEDGRTDRIIVEQFDMEASNIPASRFVVGDYANELISDLAGTLQVAIDGKIYHALPATQISIIRTPNLAQYNADYRPFAIGLGLRSSNFGLPPYVQSFFESIVTIKDLCFEDTTQFIVDPTARVTGATWNFGDPSTGAANTSTSISTSHVFSSPGLYTVTVDFEFENRIPKRFIEFVEISPILEVNEDVVLTQCDIDGIDDGRSLFNLNEAIIPIVGTMQGSDADFEIAANFFKTESDAINNQNRLDPIGYRNTVSGQVIYARVFENAECFSIAPLVLNVEPMSFADPIVIAICDTDAAPLSTTIQTTDLSNFFLDTYPDTSIAYYDTPNDALLEFNPYVDEILFGPFQTPALYYRIEFEEGCVVIGYASFDIKLPPELENQDVYYCQVDGSVTLRPPGDFNSYDWETGETTPEIEVDEPGNYEVTVSNGEGCTATMAFFVSTSSPIDIEVIISEFQQSNSLTINGSSASGGLLYSIDGGNTFSDTSIFTDLPPGYYTVVVRDREGCSEARERVLVRGVSRYFTPNNDGINDTWHADRARELGGMKLQIFDRFGKLIIELDSQSRGWDGTFNGEPLPTGSYWYHLKYEKSSYTGHFMLIRR